MKKTARSLRYDIVKYCDETQATEAEEEDEHENPNYHLGWAAGALRIKDDED